MADFRSDPHNRAQNLGTWALGKILRIRRSRSTAYKVPCDNPREYPGRAPEMLGVCACAILAFSASTVKRVDL